MKKKKTIIICIIVAVVAAGGILLTSSNFSHGPAHESSSESLAMESSKKTDYSVLSGSWIRQTGGYVIKVNKILESGQADAEYFNPRPIHVSRAMASEKNGTLNLFIELRDQGYPGSTYTLKYNSEYDALVGVYFQALMQQSFDVAFNRKK